MGSHALHQTLAGFNSSFGGYAGFKNATGSSNTFIGFKSGYANTVGSYNTFVGTYAGDLYSNSGSSNVLLGYNAQVMKENLTNTIVIGTNAKSYTSNSIVLGNSTTAMNVGIGISAPAYTLHLALDNAAKPGTSAWTVASDERLKRDVAPFKDGLDILKQINPIWFSYTGAANMPKDKKFVGIIAQEMQKIAPYTVGSFIYEDSLGSKTEYLDYNSNAVTYILINAVKQQQVVIDEKNVTVENLEKTVSELTERISNLERMFSAQQNTSGIRSAATALETNDVATLEQNVPNPFSQSTVIKFSIPKKSFSAILKIISVDGTSMLTNVITQKGTGQIEVSGRDLPSGKYLCLLIVDGEIQSKSTIHLH
jgi:hypothetical protein